MNMPPRYKPQKGFTLLELMVAFALASFAVLGLAVTQTKSLQYGYSSYQYTLASIQASNTIEEMWDDLSNLQCGITTVGSLSSPATGFTRTIINSSGVSLASTDVIDNKMTITISWTDGRQTDSENSVSVDVIFPAFFC